MAKSPNALSRRLNEIAHTLREAGIEVEFVKSPDRNRVRTIKVRKISSISSTSSASGQSVTTESDNLNAVSPDGNDNSTFGRSDGSDDKLGY